MEEKEIWKDIEGFEGLYQVSNIGNVKSLNYRRTGKEGILKAKKDSNGYLQVKLYKDGKAKFYLVHRLVGQEFLENPEGYTEINHKDEDKTNNCVQNLEWCNHSYNNSYNNKAKKAGKKVAEKLRGRKQSEEHIKKRAEKLSKPVIAIHKINGLILEFSSIMEAERETGIANQSICACCKGKRNSCGGFYWMYANVNDDDTE